MSVTIAIPTMLRHECGGAAQLSTRPASVQDILAWLSQQYPQLYRNVCDETGRVRPHINLFVNDDFLHDHQGLATQLVVGDTLTIMPAVSGG